MRPWDPLPGEPLDAHRAFARWLMGGRSRTWGGLENWRHRWGWDARADAFDSEIDAARISSELAEKAGVYGLRARAIEVATSALDAVQVRTANELAAVRAAPGSMTEETYRGLLRAAQVAARIGQAFPAPPAREELGQGIRADRLTVAERALLAELLQRAEDSTPR